jgi:hypothetical protein
VSRGADADRTKQIFVRTNRNYTAHFTVSRETTGRVLSCRSFDDNRRVACYAPVMRLFAPEIDFAQATEIIDGFPFACALFHVRRKFPCICLL